MTSTDVTPPLWSPEGAQAWFRPWLETPWKGQGLGFVTNLLVFYILEIQFKVPLPKGPLEAGLGY